MANKLFLKPLSPQVSEDEYLFDWALYDVSGRQIRSETTKGLASIEQTLMQNGVESVAVQVLWPAMSSFSAAVELPNTQARYVQQALPFAVEEMLAQDLDSVHLAIGTRNKKGSIPVIGVDKLAFAVLVDLFEESEILNLKSIVTDADCLPVEEGSLTILLGHEGAVIKTDDSKAIGLDLANLITYLDAYFDAEDEEVEFRTKLFIEERSENELKMLVAQLEQYPQLVLETEVIGVSAFELCCESSLKLPGKTIELCQGEFKVASKSANEWSRWRGVAAVAALAFVLQLGVFIGKGFYYKQEAELAGNEALATYQKLVPGSNKLSVSKLPRVIKGKLNQRSQAGASESGFLDLLGEAGYQYQRSASKGDFRFRTINFNEQRGELLIELHTKTFEQLNGFKDAIVAAGLSAKIGSSVQEKGYFRGRISVSGS